MNRATMEAGIRLFLEGLVEGERGDLDRAREATPDRVAAAWADELLVGYATDPASVIEPEPADGAKGLVAVADVRFASMCAHHLLPFGGRAGVAYLPGERLAGLGQVARLVDVLARRLQIQERLTEAVADELVRSLAPRGLVVELEAEHYCLSARGSRQPGHRLATRVSRGVLDDDRALREEALGLLDPRR
jgi:GTP cyclohydrolase I